ncbi:MAG TPA: dioxygenase [Chloroflexota bacterium]|nr:dioxygenase [Chloroflexota bacterium]
MRQTRNMDIVKPFQSRRGLLGGSATLPAALAACAFPARAQEAGEAPAGPVDGEPGAAAPSSGADAPAEILAATPDCADDDDLTPAQTEGPYFTPNSPQRTTLLESGMRGTRLTLVGHVLTTTCQPVARALVDFWQCDDGGAYDNRGYRLRGHQFTDEQGRYRLETIVPGLYPGRTRHIHVKVQAPDQRVLTTQLYFPGEPGNRRDGIYAPELELDLRDDASGKVGLFDFVLRVV